MGEETAAAEQREEELEAQAHEGRARLYGLLARLFRVEVDPLLLGQLKAMKFPASTGSPKMDAGYRLMAEYLGSCGADPLTELAVDYARTFIGHGTDAYSAAYPYESVYTSEKRLMMQAARDEVLALYRSEGIDKDPGWKDCEDHIALELEFMKVLAQRTADALRRGDAAESARLAKVQRTFRDAHLGDWIPSLAKDMRRFARTGLYLGLADLTEGFVLLDRDFLAELDDEAAQA